MKWNEMITTMRSPARHDPHKAFFRPHADWNRMLLAVAVWAVLVAGVSSVAFIRYADPVHEFVEPKTTTAIDEKKMKDVLDRYAARTAEFEALKRTRPRFIEP